MMDKSPYSKIIYRDICVAALDMAGDWTYFVVNYYFAGARGRHHAQLEAMMTLVLVVCALGTALSGWFVATSLGRLRRKKSLCWHCTIPRLALTLIAVHHVPQFVLTTWVDLAYYGSISWAGWFNILSSFLALANGLTTTKCGEYVILKCDESLGCCPSVITMDEDAENGTLEGTECTPQEGTYYVCERTGEEK